MNATDHRLMMRQRAAQLLEDVLDERLEARLAILRWPEAGEISDLSLEVAYQALWHFGADEDRQKAELFYLDAQLELLRQMAGFLKEGRDLPVYFLREYSPDQRVRFFIDLNPVEDNKLYVMRLWFQFREIWQKAWQLNPLSQK